MQTYLPYADFAESARCLDTVRLERQRVEVYDIMETLAGLRSQWANRPVMNMWRGSELILVRYGVVICNEYKRRRGRDEYNSRIVSFANDALGMKVWTKEENATEPWWLGKPGFHASHRSNLLRMNPQHYRKFWPTESAELLMVWPDYRPRQTV